MSNYTISNLKSATIKIIKNGEDFEIIANKKACEKMDYPFTDGKIFNSEGENYRSVQDFIDDYGIELTHIDGHNYLEDSEKTQILTEFSNSGEFSSIQEIKRIAVSFEARNNRKPTILVEITVTAGKFKPNGKAKKWFDKNVDVKGKVKDLKNKWIFLDGDIFVKEFSKASYKLV